MLAFNDRLTEIIQIITIMFVCVIFIPMLIRFTTEGTKANIRSIHHIHVHGVNTPPRIRAMAGGTGQRSRTHHATE